MFNQNLDYKSMKVFGYSCFPYLRPYNKQKLYFHTKRCVFIGYNNFHKSYKYLSEEGKAYTVVSFTFDEKFLPLKENVNFVEPSKAIKNVTEKFLNKTNSFYIPVSSTFFDKTIPFSLSKMTKKKSPMHPSPCNNLVTTHLKLTPTYHDAEIKENQLKLAEPNQQNNSSKHKTHNNFKQTRIHFP